jgi:uncharacterized protein YraI
MSKRTVLLIFTLGVMLLVGLTVTQAQDGGLAATIEDNVRFRSGPGTNWRILTNLTAGTAITLDARDGTNNFWVRGIVADGTVGWLTSNALNVSADQIAGLPIKTVDEPFNLSAPAASANASAPADNTAAEAAPAASVPQIAAPANLPSVGRFAYGGHVEGFGETTINYMRYAGMTWVKKQVRYSDGMQPTDVAWMIGDAHNKGFRVLLGVVGYPQQLNNPGYADRYAGFVGGLAALGADAIEVWNEPNIDREWPAGQISPASYTSLLAVSYNAIKANNRGTVVISGAPAPTGFFGGCSGFGCDDIYFIAGMADAGAANYMDCVGVHYNEGIVPPTARSGDPRGNSGYYTRYFQPMIETYSGAFGGRVPLCFTEMGYLTPEGYGGLPGGFWWAGDVTLAQQAAWLDQAVSIARNSGRVKLLIVWNVDFTGYGADPMGGYAMIRPDGSCPACDALAR